MESEFVVVFITAPSMEIGETIAQKLVDDHLAACVNLIDSIRSIYRWEGQVTRDQEVLLICKTRRELLEDAFIPLVRSLHPYQVPEIIALPVETGHAHYLTWIRENTSTNSLIQKPDLE